MELIPILVLCSISFLLYYTYTHHQKQLIGGKTPMVLKPSEQYYSRQFNELHDINRVFDRKVSPGDETTNNTKGFPSSFPIESQPAELHPYNQKKVYLDLQADPFIEPADASQGLKDKVEARQPYFLRKPYIKKHYGQKYYADWRYPLFLVNTDFAENPQKFLTDHPKEYPSYVITQRTPVDCDIGCTKDAELGPWKSYEPKSS